MAPPGYRSDVSKVNVSSKNKKTTTAYKLRQIVIRSDHRSAVINGYVVTEGEYVKSALVKSIKQNKVVLQVADKQRTLYLKPNTARVRH